ncbi:MAG: hypothetical protein ABJB01_02970, partial [Rudaea sp.]
MSEASKAIDKIDNTGSREAAMWNYVGFLFIGFICIASSGCLSLKGASKPDDLLVSHDQVLTFVARRPFDEVWTAVRLGANKCWGKSSVGLMAPTGSGFIALGGGVSRGIDNKLIEENKLATVSVVAM